MAADNLRVVEEIPEFSSAPVGKVEEKPTVRFKLDGQLYTLRQPKASIAMMLIRLTEANQTRFNQSEITEDVLMLTRQMCGYVEEEPQNIDGTLNGRALLWHRLHDPEDELDLKHLAPAFSELLGKIFDRPTGSQPASPARPRRISNGSGAGSRSRKAVTSGN